MVYFYILMTVHSLLCFALIGVVLLQQGKGADAGAALAGGSNTLFGASGAKTVLTKVTTGIAVAFMCTSVLLVRWYTYNSSVLGTVAPSGTLGNSIFDQPSAVAPAPEQAGPATAEPAKQEPAAATAAGTTQAEGGKN